jgi:hypothetical protein
MFTLPVICSHWNMIAEVCVRHCHWILSAAKDARCCNLIWTAAKCDEVLVDCCLVFQEH